MDDIRENIKKMKLSLEKLSNCSCNNSNNNGGTPITPVSNVVKKGFSITAIVNDTLENTILANYPTVDLTRIKSLTLKNLSNANSSVNVNSSVANMEIFPNESLSWNQGSDNYFLSTSFTNFVFLTPSRYTIIFEEVI